MSLKDKVKTVRTVSWFELMDPLYKTFKIIPDSSIRNWRTEELIRTFSDQFEIPLDRIVHEGLRIKGYRVQERASFEIEFTAGKVNFYVSVPENVAPLLYRRLSSVWDKATIEEVDGLKPFSEEKTVIQELIYKKHDIYSLHVDSKSNAPLGSLLEGGKLLTGDDRARVFVYFDPMNQMMWHHKATEAWQKLRNGMAPRKLDGGIRTILTVGAIYLSKALGELVTGISTALAEGHGERNMYAENKSDPEASQYAIHNLSPTTRTKVNRPVIKTYLWVLSESKEESRREMIAKTLANAYTDLAEDNELRSKKVTSKKKREAIFNTVNTKKPIKINIGSNIMSTSEAGELVRLPGQELQEQFKEVERVDQVQIEVNGKLIKPGGMYLGDATYKGDKQKIFEPTDSVDETCLPSVAIGGMGQGKTLGFGANRVVEAIRQGYGVIAVDAAKREIGNEVKKVLPPEKVEVIDLSQQVFSLDWCEAEYSDKAKARLAGTIMSFFNTSVDETGGQTERFIRAAVIGMKTGKLNEIIQIFEDDKYLDKIIKDMPEGLNKRTLEQYKKEKEGRRTQILSPIYNRLNVILSDPHLAECFESTNSLDMVEIMTQRKAVIFDVPDDSLDSTAIDIIVNLLTSKIDLAMRLRKRVKGPEYEFPFFIVLDEPHKYNKSAKIWESAVVESRKWRVKYNFMFHYWEQVPSKLQKAIKSALVHYHIYPSSKDTFKGLKEEMYPFTVEDGLKLKKFHAINILRYEGCKPFIAQMAKPPSQRKDELSDVG